jgi:PAS domain S-box-containing protein
MDCKDASSQSDAARRQALIASFGTRALSEPLDLDTLLTEAAVHAGAGLGVAHAKVLQYCPEADHLLVRAGVGWKSGVVGRATLSSGMASPPGRALRTGEAVSIADIRGEEDFVWSDLLRQHGVVSLLNVPVRVFGPVAWGVLEVDAEAPHQFSLEHEHFLVSLAALLGAAIRRLEAEAERHRADEALRESEARLRALADNLPSSMVYQVAMQRDGTGRRFVYIAQSCERLTGVSAEAAFADPAALYERILPEDRPGLGAAETEAIRNLRPFEFEARFAHADTGEVRWCRIASSPRELTDGALIWDGLLVDLTERRAAEERLRESEEMLRLSQQATLVGSFERDFRAGTLRWSAETYAIYGLPVPVFDEQGAPMLVANWLDAIHPEDRDRLAAEITSALACGAPELTLQYRIRRAGDGAERYLEARSRYFYDTMGHPLRAIGAAIDVTEQKETEAALRELSATLENRVAERTRERNRVWELSGDLLAVMDFDGRLKSINPAWSELLQLDEATLMAAHISDLVHPDDHAAVTGIVAALRRGEVVRGFENRLRQAGGAYITISWTAVPEGEVFYAVGRDVTREKEREEQLRQAQKMEAVGQLTGGIAHDFNNLLTAVLGSLELLRKRLPTGDERVSRLLDNAVQGAQRGASLTQRLLAFSRGQALNPKAVDVPEVVRGMSDLLRSSLGAGVRVETLFPLHLAPAHVDANQLELALLNLAVNARDAMLGTGQLTIAAREERVEVGQAGELAPGDYVVLGVTDTGEGMDEATLARCVEPFFTTKGIGKGTGLGLSMVYGLAEQSGGRLVLRSRKGDGTTAELWLPRAEAEATPTARPGVEMADLRLESPGRHTVLMVDDDPLVLASAASMLEDLGHAVVEAASGRQALEILRAGAKVDLIVTDQAMPGMTGIQLAAEVRRLWPGLPVLLGTGYVERAEMAASGLPLLGKPFGQAELAAAIEACLSATGQAGGNIVPFPKAEGRPLT